MNNSVHVEFAIESDIERYEANSTLECCENCLMFISEQFNTFLKQAGFDMPNNFILMKSLTEEEYYMLEEYLENIRSEGEYEE